jgi:hypothetical protein
VFGDQNNFRRATLTGYSDADISVRRFAHDDATTMRQLFPVITDAELASYNSGDYIAAFVVTCKGLVMGSTVVLIDKANKRLVIVRYAIEYLARSDPRFNYLLTTHICMTYPEYEYFAMLNVDLHQ